MNPQGASKRKVITIIAALLAVCVLLGVFFFVATPWGRELQSPTVRMAKPTVRPSPTLPPTPTPSPTPTPVPTLPAVKNPGQILGIQGDPQTAFPGIPWVRLGYPSCGWGDLKGDVLKKTVEDYHKQNVRVLLTVCQGKNDASLYDTAPLQDAAQGEADAVQCGNEEMKSDAAVAFLYIPPENFAKFYDLCEHAVHAVRADIPVLLGSLDPHVGGVDYQPLLNQVYYLNQMQYAMNTSVHPGGKWDWHSQTLGLIDSWHNGYPDASVNSLLGLFNFWAQQFGVDLNSGALGKHLWVVEGTGCFKGCGIDPYNNYQVAVSHILALITDVQTAMRYSIPFFYFSGKDFMDQGIYWPIGVLDANGHPKPIRQDLGMGARSLAMSCSSGTVKVTSQEDLLARMYAGCSLPGQYIGSLY
ncbi:hypothetical protein EPA93_36935 [Ktedonosporobacter rubrisoli]|uniref:Uncharacterized protein n=1 Tax=Ktedonosporobacter rubrisoli TaxID=2509675 RepID=A0A4P6K1E3_KTERU|nr:hypothetical protein [Ktedonosporobacter rubrisoli]QBD81266.1 hypothetical protein EPA93_36935 [Ktedonosporobacter rubrisoli]